MSSDCVPLIKRLPEIWRRLDEGEVLERYLGVWDQELGELRNQVEEFLPIHNPSITPDKFLALAAALVGHQRRTDKPPSWNRRRIMEAIRWWSQKGTHQALHDLVLQHGSDTGFGVTDQASKLLVLGKQGRLGHPDAYLVSADYWHDGAFVLSIGDSVELVEFLRDFATFIQTGGERWYFAITSQQNALYEAIWVDQEVVYQPQWRAQGSVGFGRLGSTLIVSTQPNGWQLFSSSPVYWDQEGTFDGLIGFGGIGVELIVSTQPNGQELFSSSPVHWNFELPEITGGIGFGQLGISLVLGWEPLQEPSQTALASDIGIMGGIATLDSAFLVNSPAINLSVSAANPLGSDDALTQPDGEIN